MQCFTGHVRLQAMIVLRHELIRDVSRRAPSRDGTGSTFEEVVVVTVSSSRSVLTATEKNGESKTAGRGWNSGVWLVRRGDELVRPRTDGEVVMFAGGLASACLTVPVPSVCAAGFVGRRR